MKQLLMTSTAFHRMALWASCMFLMAALFAGAAAAQLSGTATIQGTVTDATGAVIPKARVQITETTTNTDHTSVTTGAGFYSVAGLQPGSYRVTIKALGFRTFTQENITLDALQVLGPNVKLKVGSTDTSVTVTEAPPAL